MIYLLYIYIYIYILSFPLVNIPGCLIIYKGSSIKDVRPCPDPIESVKTSETKRKIYCDPDQNILRSTEGGGGVETPIRTTETPKKTLSWPKKCFSGTIFFSGRPVDGRPPVRGCPLWSNPPPLLTGRL